MRNLSVLRLVLHANTVAAAAAAVSAEATFQAFAASGPGAPHHHPHALVETTSDPPAVGPPRNSGRRRRVGALRRLWGASSSSPEAKAAEDKYRERIDTFDESKNAHYINGLLQNLSVALDKWIMTGSLATRRRAYNIIKQVEREALDKELAQRASRMATRAGMPLEEPPTEKPKKVSLAPPSNVAVNSAGSDPIRRKAEADARKEWEASRMGSGDGSADGVAGPGAVKKARSALSARAANNGKPDLFMPEVDRNLDPMEFAESKKGLEDALGGKGGGGSAADTAATSGGPSAAAAAQASELVARAGGGSAFEGETLGIGGLDNVLGQVKRRVWVPLAAPPSLLSELGINPVRGLLLYGAPGCGKTLLARSLGRILSPARPITVVSGPEIMDKFVGSSEANLRAIFDNPPGIYDSYQLGQDDDGKAIEEAALHVIVMDEFDAVARTRGGSGKSQQGDAGVARDSVVNQLLAKMDGVDPLKVPTLVIGLTNKRTLIEPALLRAGRFEVQIEVPPPRTVEQRVSILKVHMTNMFKAGRLLVSDAPDGTAAARRLDKKGKDGVLAYAELLDLLAVECDGMSGASLAGVARAAASRALERAVFDFAGHCGSHEEYVAKEGGSIADCLVTQEDLEKAVEDVFESSKGGDGEGCTDVGAEEGEKIEANAQGSDEDTRNEPDGESG